MVQNLLDKDNTVQVIAVESPPSLHFGNLYQIDDDTYILTHSRDDFAVLISLHNGNRYQEPKSVEAFTLPPEAKRVYSIAIHSRGARNLVF
jgi:hypothetical protein